MAAQHMATHMASTQRKRKSPVKAILITLVVLALLGAGGFFAYQRLMILRLTVNGQQVEARRGDTVQALLDAGYATPTPGDLMAVDGEVLQEGAGETCSVTVNGNTVDAQTKLVSGAVVQIDDGADVVEDSTVTEEAIPFETSGDPTDAATYYNGSIHLLSDGVEGKRVVRTGNVSGKVVEESVTQPVDAGYRVYTAHPADRVIALTFDDGPWPDSTNQILDILQEYDAKATFFTIGNQISSWPDAVKRANDMGCQVCTHTWDHASGSGQGLNLTFMTAEEQVDEVQKGFAAIQEVLGEEPAHIMRAPGGNFYGDLIQTLWPYVDAEIGWNIDTEDWKQPGTDAIVSAILSVEPGQVILMHDGGGDRSQTVEALRQAMPILVERGYSFVTINELLAYGA